MEKNCKNCRWCMKLPFSAAVRKCSCPWSKGFNQYIIDSNFCGYWGEISEENEDFESDGMILA